MQPKLCQLTFSGTNSAFNWLRSKFNVYTPVQRLEVAFTRNKLAELRSPGKREFDQVAKDGDKAGKLLLPLVKGTGDCIYAVGMQLGVESNGELLRCIRSDPSSTVPCKFFHGPFVLSLKDKQKAWRALVERSKAGPIVGFKVAFLKLADDNGWEK